MTEDLRMKRGDTAPSFRARCLDGTTPVDLTTATAVTFLLRRGRSTVLSVLMTVEDQVTNTGWVHYDWGSTDLAYAGRYRVEVQVTWPDDRIQTFPSDTYANILVVSDLG